MATQYPNVVAWKLRDWLPLVSSTRSAYDQWPPEIRPHTVLVGRYRLVVESPQDWLARMAAREVEQKRKRRGRRLKFQAAAEAEARSC